MLQFMPQRRATVNVILCIICAMRLSIDVTPAEAAEVAERASAAGVSVLAYIRRAVGLRWIRPVGRPVILKDCPLGCGDRFSAREMRRHVPTCRLQAVE